MPGTTKNTERSKTQPVPIAIVGIGTLFPGSSHVSGFWRDIVTGRDLITEVPPTHWIIADHYDPDPAAADKTYSKRGAFLSPTDFDPMEFGIPPANLPSTDTSQLLGLVVAKQVLADAAQGRLGQMDRDRISVILGVAAGLELLGEMVSRLQRPAWSKALRESGIAEDQVTRICDRIAGLYTPWKESTFPGLLGNVVAGRIANHFDLGGTNCTVDAACASSLSAMSMAVNELCLGLSDMVITGGVDTTNGPFLYTCFSKTPALSRSDDCRPFSDKSDGMLLGEGIGMVALKRLEDAERDGDRIYAVLKAIGTSSDGSGTSVYSPLPGGQAKALRQCYRIAGYNPATVELVEAHGTGTHTGDGAEFKALTQVFDEADRKDRQWCALGSIKSQIGHTKSAAGVAGVIKAVLALHHKVLPPTIKVDRPDPRLDLAGSPFYLNTSARPWIRDARYPRRASVSSFGFGGTNFHVALEEYTGSGNHAWRRSIFPTELVLLGAQDAAALLARCQKIVEDLGRVGMLAFLARTSQEAFNPQFAARMAIVAADEPDLGKKINQAMAFLAANPGTASYSADGIHYHFGVSNPGATALLFPGQGSEYLGMGADLAMHMDTAATIWEMAAALPMGKGPRLQDVVFPPPVFDPDEQERQIQRFKSTQWAQPAISATSLSMLTVIKTLGIRPDCVGGHGLGEITALFAAGVLDQSGLLQAVRRRAELMAVADPGIATVIAHPLHKIQPRIEQWQRQVTVAEHNSPRQVVLYGPLSAIEEVEQRLADQGIDSRRLLEPATFHGPQMSNSCGPFLEFLKDMPFSSPDRPIYSNAEAAPYPPDVDKIRELLAGQFASPVRFVEQIEAMYANGVRTFLEVGPGSVLTGQVDQCLEGRPHVAVNMDRKSVHGITSLWEALGRLAVNGVTMDFSPIWGDRSPVTDPRLKKKPGLVVPILGSNYAKPYPPPEEAALPPKPNVPENELNPIVSAAAQVPSQCPKMEEMLMEENKGPDRDPVHRTTCALPAQKPLTGHCSDAGLPKAAVSDPAPWPAGGHKNSGDWLKAFEELQRQTAETHTAFQQSMADSHMAFLKAAESATQTLRGMIAGRPFHRRETGGSENESRPTSSPGCVADPLPEPQHQNPLQATMVNDAEAGQVSSVSGLQTQESTGQGSANPDQKALLLQVIADKTGYPAEILRMDMELESDLGIDSIKRVEILAAIKDLAPELPEIDTDQMADLRTLDDVLAYLQRLLNRSDTGEPAAAAIPVRSAVEPSDRRSRPDPDRYVLRAVFAPYSGFSKPGLSLNGTVVVTNDGTGVAWALAKRLKGLNVDAQVVSDIPEHADAVVFLGGLRPCHDPEAALAINREAFLSARKVAKGLTASGGLFVTVQDTGGDFGLSDGDENRVWMAGLPGLVKTAAIEWPGVSVKAIDLERGGRSPDELAEALSRELLAGGSDLEIGLLADGMRVRLECYPSAIGQLEPSVNDESVIVATGGARGVTAVALIELARRLHPRIVLLGRTPLIDEPDGCQGAETENDLKRAFLETFRAQGRSIAPVELGARVQQILANRQIRATLQSLQAAGSEVRYFAGDIRDAATVGTALDWARRHWGPITGIVHGAGVLDDKLIAEKSPESFDLVFNTKVQGLQSLLAATADDPLRMIALFSSAAARFGNKGQCDYAMANEILNKVAQAEARRRRRSCVVKSLNWGPWDGGMVSPALKARFEQMGIPLIPLDAGARIFVHEIQAGGTDAVEVIIGRLLHQPDLSAAPVDKDMHLPLRVDQKDYPFIDSHKIQDVPVVPTVMVLEWFLRAAHQCRPDLRFIICRDLRVLKGIRLGHFCNGGDRFILSCRQDANGGAPVLTLGLHGPDNVTHFAATVETDFADRLPCQAQFPLSTQLLKPWPLTLSQIYDDHLFHGPDFHVIRSLEGVSEHAASAVLAGTHEIGWPGDSWKADVAALDGGLQLAMLWGSHLLGKMSLPTRIGRYICCREGLITGPIRCVLQGRVFHKIRTVSDISFSNASGQLVAKLEEVEMHVLPGNDLNSPEAS